MDPKGKEHKGLSDGERLAAGRGEDPAGEVLAEPTDSEIHHMTKKELEEKVLELESRLKEAETRGGEFKDDLQRLQAEFENYRKRMVREQTRVIDQANRALVEKLLPVIDNLEKALESPGARDDNLAQGVRMVYQQLMDLLRQEGLEEINPYGHPFDPEVCEAVSAVISDDHEDETVVEVHQKGYKFKGNLLRPARATVSKCNRG